MPDLKPVCYSQYPTSAEIDAFEHAIALAGIREYPYPFNSAFAVTSDIDRSNRQRYAGYVGALVRDNGLDFGDSVWLQTNQVGKFQGLGFFSKSIQTLDRQDHGRLDSEMDQYELAAEFHKGNIDHWHGLLVRGSRFTIHDVASHGTVLEHSVELPPLPDGNHNLFGARNFPIWGVGFVARGEELPKPSMLRLTLKDGTVTALPLTATTLVASACVKSFSYTTVGLSCEASETVPELSSIAAFSLMYEKPASVEAILLLNSTREMLLERIDWLKDALGVSFSLITIHAQWMINDYWGLARSAEQNAGRLAERLTTLESFFSEVCVSGLTISTLSDAKGSFARLYPDLVNHSGTIFWRCRPEGPHPDLNEARESDRALMLAKSIFDCVIPAIRRDHGAIQVAVSTMSKIRSPVGRGEIDERTIGPNFIDRTGAILDEMAARGKGSANLYTHLGNLMHNGPPPEPYFAPEGMARFRRLCHGIGYQPDEGPRLWFVRASQLCWYALLMRKLPELTTRHGRDIHIARYDDPTGLRLPGTKYHLYGVTFYVDDPAATRVFLGGVEILDLARNPPDITGRPSITIMACPIGITVMRAVNAASRFRIEGIEGDAPARLLFVCGSGSEPYHRLEHAPSRWWPVGRSSVALEGRRKSSVRLAMDPFTPEGAQLLRLKIRRSRPDVRLLLTVRTASGGNFVVGDEPPPHAAGKSAARFRLPAVAPDACGWQSYIVPLQALDWSDEAHAGPLAASLPSTGISTIDLALDASAGDAIDLAEISFRRPRPDMTDDGTVFIGGQLDRRVDGHRICLERLDTGKGIVRECTTDHLGGFAFGACPAGAYRVTCIDSQDRIVVEAFESRHDIRLRSGRG